VKVTGLNTVKTAIQTNMREMRAAMAVVTDQSAALLLDEMKFLASRIDHDLDQLRRMGHPYAKDKPQGQPHPDWLVHIQSGELQGGLKRGPISISGQVVEAQILSEARHTWFLLLGTSKMRARDFVSAAIIRRRVEIEAMYLRAFMEQLDNPHSGAFRTQVTLIPHPVYPAQLPGTGGS
jgi:hypothetical protein